MFQWDDKYQWIFSDLGSSDKVGVNESGIGIFKRQPYKGLAKEILQNVTDAKNLNLPDEVPVKVKFELINVDVEDIPGYKRLREVIHKCADYYSDGDDGEKMRNIQLAADIYLCADTSVPVLKISDYNTTGLRGVKRETGSNWTGLVRERSATNKSNESSGAFGVGKFAPYNFTSIRTVLYSTKTIDGEYAFQGKSILTTFKEDGKNKQNIGLFANTESENFDAVFDMEDVATVFRRSEIGTDIFVLGFEEQRDWIEQSALSVIEYFFYSIYKGELEVKICDKNKDIEINQKNLGEMIKYFEQYYKNNLENDVSFRFTTPSYWRLLQSDNHIFTKAPFEYNGKSMGDYELYLQVGDDNLEKRVLEMRQAGMKIREDTAFKIAINFTAIFIATGEGAVSNNPEDNISSFLRKCENQAHDDWAADEYKEEKKKAKGIINRVHQIILEAVKKEMPDFGDESVDAFGLSEFLPNEDVDDDPKEEQAFADFRPLTFEIQSIKTGKKRVNADISMKTNGGGKHQQKKKKTKKYHKRSNNQKGTGIGKVSEVMISDIKTPFDTVAGEYQISFILNENVEDLIVGIKIGSDDDNLSKANISIAMMNGKDLPIKNGMIEIKGKHIEGEKNVLRVGLGNQKRSTLEVRAYAKR